MMGLMTRSPSSAARLNAGENPSYQSLFSVSTSIRMFESTRVRSVATGQRHDLLGGHPHVAASAQARHDPIATPRRGRRAYQLGRAVLDDEVHLIARVQAEFLTHGDGDRHLPLV